MNERRLAGAWVGEGGWERVEVQEVGEVRLIGVSDVIG